MKVKIMYSAELEELTSKFAELSKKNVSKLNETAKLLESVAQILDIEGDEAVVFATSRVDKVRRELVSVDDSLNEIVALMSGYINNILNPTMPQANPSHETQQPLEEENSPPPAWDPKNKVYYDREAKNEEQE